MMIIDSDKDYVEMRLIEFRRLKDEIESLREKEIKANQARDDGYTTGFRTCHDALGKLLDEARTALAEKEKELQDERDKVRKLRDGLERMQWLRNVYEEESIGKWNPCPACIAEESDGHDKNCWLSELLEETKPSIPRSPEG